MGASGTPLAGETPLAQSREDLSFTIKETAMKFKTLMAVAVAGAFPVPLAAPPQGAGGPPPAPSADHPQGTPPYTAPAGSQDSGAVTPGSRAKRPTSRFAGARGARGGRGSP